MTYFNYQQIWKKPPSSWEEIFTLADAPVLDEDRRKLQLVKDCGYEIAWGTDTAGDGQPSTVVLGYLPDAKKKGGDVLFLGGSVRPLTAQELATQLGE